MVFLLCNTPIVLTDPLVLSAVAVVSKSMGLQNVCQNPGLASSAAVMD